MSGRTVFRMALLAAAVALLMAPWLAGCGDSYRIGPSPEHSRPAGDDDDAPRDDSSPPSSRATHAVLYTNLTDSPETKRKYTRWNVKPAKIIYQHFIDPEATGRWDDAGLTRRWIAGNIPENWDGPLCLDWEGGNLNILKKGPSHPRFNATILEMVKLINDVKRLRPRAQVGYYNIPIREYWKQTEEWEENSRLLAPIINASDVLFAPIYDFYGDMDRLEAQDNEHHGNYVRLALECAKGKPVLLYTWDQYHGSSPQFQGPIPEAEIRRHVNAMLNVHYNGKRPAGVVAWTDPRQKEPARFERFYQILDEAIKGVRLEER